MTQLQNDFHVVLVLSSPSQQYDPCSSKSGVCVQDAREPNIKQYLPCLKQHVLINQEHLWLLVLTFVRKQFEYMFLFNYKETGKQLFYCWLFLEILKET